MTKGVCIDRAADDRRRARRPYASLLGGHVLSAVQHRLHAVIRKVRRSTRPQDRASGSDRPVPGGIHSVRLSQNMMQLIMFRGLQGIGGGG